jgi:hypothetical protein
MSCSWWCRSTGGYGVLVSEWGILVADAARSKVSVIVSTYGPLDGGEGRNERVS